MINKIFLDADNTLIFTDLSDPGQEHIRFILEDSLNPYYTIVRPCTQRIIDHCRELVGRDNVYILTTATEDYITAINEKAGWGFDKEHLISRKEIERRYVPTAYGRYHAVERGGVAHEDNVLIDNLPPKENGAKIALIGIGYDRYLKVDDYYGVNGTEWDTFEKDVMEFLKEKMDKN